MSTSPASSGSSVMPRTRAAITTIPEPGRWFVCGDQSCRTSAPRWPQREQTMRAPSGLSGVSSACGSSVPFKIRPRGA
jgi:hypothetical protein